MTTVMGTTSNGRPQRPAVLIDRANAIPVTSVLSDHFGVLVPSEIPPGQSWKTYCPFAWEHPDGGLDKQFRVYGSTNSSYCFAMHGQMNPVRLFVIKHDVRPVEAARRLLKAYGLFNFDTSYRDRFNKLVEERATRRTAIGDTQYLVEALHTALSQHEAYSSRQFDGDFASAMEEQLESLDNLLSTREADEDDVREWFKQTRSRLTDLLGGSGV